MILYINGCSWSSMSDHDMNNKVYGDYLSEKNNWQLINHAAPGSCNNRIIRSSIYNIQRLLLTQNSADIICILNMTMPARGEVWLDDAGLNLLFDYAKNKLKNDRLVRIMERVKLADDGYYLSWTPASAHIFHDLFEWFPGYYKHNLLLESSEEKFLYDLFSDLLMFTSYMKSRKIKYLIFFAHSISKKSKAVINHSDCFNPMYKEICSDNAILNLDDEVFLTWARANNYKFFEDDNKFQLFTNAPGHPDTVAHAAWAEYLDNKLKSLYEI